LGGAASGSSLNALKSWRDALVFVHLPGVIALSRWANWNVEFQFAQNCPEKLFYAGSLRITTTGSGSDFPLRVRARDVVWAFWGFWENGDVYWGEWGRLLFYKFLNLITEYFAALYGPE